MSLKSQKLIFYEYAFAFFVSAVTAYHKSSFYRLILQIKQENLFKKNYNEIYTTRKIIKRATEMCVHFIFISNSCLNNSNCAMASKYYDFELRANLFHDIKVDKNFCLHCVALNVQ